MKKVRFKIPFTIKETLQEDREHFNIEIGKMGNHLIRYYSNKKMDKFMMDSKKGEVIQFNLTRENEKVFFKILQDNDFEVEAEYLRNIFFSYVNNPRYKREEILFEENFNLLNKAIKDNKKVYISYNDETRTINPYFIKVADRENRSYLFCYCEKNDDYRCYRISDITDIYTTNLDIKVLDKKYIDNMNKNFDPFRSFGKRVKTRITAEGEKLLNKAINNRPKVIEKKDDIWIFECDPKLAQIYFPQFLEEVEILEPLELREWFKEKFNKVYNLYSNK